MKKANLLGYQIDTYSYEEAVSFAKTNFGQVVTINPEMMSNPDLKNIINNSELVIPDGIGAQVGLKIMGYNVKRIAGIEFAYRMMFEFAKDGKSIALVGAKPEIVKKAEENLIKEIPNLNIVYAKDGYFQDEESVISELIASNPDLVLCALGSPKQELFINKIKKMMPKTLFIGVGGSFDVWAGAVERAPEIWQKMGLEWLYRTLKEPKRFKRIFPALPLFVLRVLKEKYIRSNDVK